MEKQINRFVWEERERERSESKLQLLQPWHSADQPNCCLNRVNTVYVENKHFFFQITYYKDQSNGVNKCPSLNIHWS